MIHWGKLLINEVMPMSWIRSFFFLLCADIKAIPLRVCGRYYLMKMWYYGYIYRKIYEDESLFFQLLFLPSLFFSEWKDKRSAKILGKTLEQFQDERVQQREAEISAMRARNNQTSRELMMKFAEILPGATINDYDEFVEHPRTYSLSFLGMSIKEILFGRREF